MIWLLLIPVAVALIYLAVAGRRDREPLAPMPPVTDTVTGMADRSRGERLTAPPFDQDGGDAA